MRPGEGVRIELDEPFRRGIVLDEFTKTDGMDTLHLLRIRTRRRAPFKRGEVRRGQHFLNGGVTAGMLHMAGLDFMSAESCVGV